MADMVSEFKVTCEYDHDAIKWILHVYERAVEVAKGRGPWRCVATWEAYPHDGHLESRDSFRLALRHLVR